MSSLDTLAHAVAAEPTLERSLMTLIEGLADRIKATSNDQNSQRLARELRGAGTTFVAAVAGKVPA
jgi:hypothetical protein